MVLNLYPISHNHKITGIGLQYTDSQGVLQDIELSIVNNQDVNQNELKKALERIKNEITQGYGS